VKKIQQHGEDQERQTIIDWLTPLNYAPQQNDLIALQQEGTGQWLLKSAEFNSWLEQANQTLYCPGIPGAGKTIITSIVIRYLFNKFGRDPSVGIAYLYCNFWQRNEQKAADFIPSLVKQLVQQQPTIHKDVKNLYYRHRASQTRPSLEEILSVLHHVASSYSRTFIIIDALDECQGSYESRGKLLQQVFDVQLKTKLNIFATSRFIQEIERHFHHSIRLEIRASDEDVQRYIDARLQYFPSFVIKSAALVADIRSKVTKAVDGM
jgi:Cdc6-like AAA superfamily ATPase